MFPTKNVHDDLIDALSMISQMAITTYRGGIDDDAPEWEPLDVISGL